MKKLFSALFIMLVIISAQPLSAENTGRILTNQCRENIKELNETTEKMLQKYHYDLPPWRALDTFYKETKLFEFLDKKPIPPTLDCSYYLVSTGNKDYQWCCYLHGVINGDKTINFMYHEHAIVSKINSKYETIEDYSTHVKSMLHWTNYQQTVSEYIKYNYHMNPISTILFIIGALVVVFIVYKSVY